MRLLAFLLLLPGLAFGQTQTEVPHVFEDGQPAKASEVNENFDALETAIDAVAAVNSEQQLEPWGSDINYRVVVADCTSDPLTLSEVYLATLHINPVVYLIKGVCELNHKISGRTVAFSSLEGSPEDNVVTSEGEGGEILATSSNVWFNNVSADLRQIDALYGSVVRFNDTYLKNRRGSDFVFKAVLRDSMLKFGIGAQPADFTWPKIEARLWSSTMHLTLPTFNFDNIWANIGSKVWCLGCDQSNLGRVTVDVNSTVCVQNDAEQLSLESLSVQTNSSFSGHVAQGFNGLDFDVQTDESSVVKTSGGFPCFDYSTNPS